MLAMKYDGAHNKHASAALYTQDAVLGTYSHGTFHARQAIEKEYANWDFERWQYSNYVTRVLVLEGDTWKIRRDTMGGTAANAAGIVH
jgi:hypothetical protein